MPKRFACGRRSLKCGRFLNKPLDALQNIAIISLFICLTIFIPQIGCLSDASGTLTSANTNDWLVSTHTNPDSQLPGEELSSEQKLLMSTRLPRQHFRLNLMPSSGKSNFKLVKIQRSRATKKAGSTSTTTSTTTTPMPTQLQRLDASDKPRQPIHEKRLPKGQGKKISNAVLRKLLNQTLPKLNSSNTNVANATENKGPSFKFVFIQRGSQPPTPGSPGTTSNFTKTRQPSLAANVTKQLAQSLLYSAVNLVANLSSVSSAPGNTLTPQLSGLASLNHQLDDLSNELAPSSLAPISTTSPPPSIQGDSDVLKLASEQQQQQHSTTTKSKPTRKPRPSKIYNLPVKFVANGQPNHVMFLAIKQHFATIKQLKQSVNAQSASYQGNSATKRRKAHKQNDRTRLKGKNSRFIHLPLKYLSNARPNLVNVIMATKASHKAAPKLTSTSVAPS